MLEADGKLAEARATIEEQEARLQLLEKDRSRLLVAQDELSSSVQEKEDEVARLKGTAQELEEKMKAEIGRGEDSPLPGERSAPGRPRRQDPVRLG